MTISSSQRWRRPVGAIALLGASLALMGCGAEKTVEPVVSPPTPSSANASGECAGVTVVVEFGSLDSAGLVRCAQTSEPITALEAFDRTGVKLTEGQAFPGSICRVEGEPVADRELTYSGETYTEDCSAMGPVWAYWGLFVDLGNGWEYAQEGAAAQQVAPGQGIAFSWQFGDTTVPQLPAA